MPVVVAESSTMAEHIRYRKPRTQTHPETDLTPNPPPIPSIIQSTRCKSTISSLLLNSFTSNDTPTNNTPTTTKKKNLTFRGLGCAAAPQVSVPAAIRSSANWEAKKVRKKKARGKNKNNPHGGLAMVGGTTNTACIEGCVVDDVWCGPGMGFTTDASVDCVVVSRRPVVGSGGGRGGRVDGDKLIQRERISCPARRTTNPDHISFLESDNAFGMARPGLDVYGSRYHRHVRHRSPEGLAEIVMLQSSLLLGGRSDGFDRHRNWRLDVDNLSYEELLELGDRIGYVNTGLREDEIAGCLRKTKLSILDDVSLHFQTEMERKCSICQEEYEGENEIGKLDCGHFYHIQCIKEWLMQKNMCPICKTEAIAQYDE